MGVRDIMVFNAYLDMDFAKQLDNKINYINNLMYQELKDEIDKDKNGVKVLINYEDNLNFSEAKIHYSKLNNQNDFALLTVNTKMKNYNDEFEKFLEYIAPHVCNLDNPNIVNTLGFIKHDNDDLTVYMIEFENNKINIKKAQKVN